MRTLILQLSLVIIISSCSSYTEAEKNNLFKPKTDTTNAVETNLPNKEKYEVAPYVPVYDETFSEQNIEKIKINVCNGKLDNECAQVLFKSFMAGLQDHYSRTNWPDVQRKCDMYPVECKDLKTFETWVASSNNSELEDLNARESSRIIANEKKKRTLMWGEFFKGMAPKD